MNIKNAGAHLKNYRSTSIASILALCFLCFSTSIVSADPVNGVNILSQSYSVSGSYGFTWNQDDGNMGGALYSQGSGTFGESSNDGTPLNGGYATPSPSFPGLTSGLYVNYSINTFAFQFNGFALQNQFPITGSDGLGYWMIKSGITSSAQASWLFQPTSENQQIILNLFQNGSYFYDQNLAVTLTDVTDLNALLAYSYGFGVSWPGQAAQTYAFSLNPNDQYQLTVSSQSGTYDSDDLNQQFSASIEPAPEPSTFCLFPLALVSFIASRKHLRVGNK
jgi:hypothetical protein